VLVINSVNNEDSFMETQTSWVQVAPLNNKDFQNEAAVVEKLDYSFLFFTVSYNFVFFNFIKGGIVSPNKKPQGFKGSI
jgi:hypothetical protein